MKSFHFTQHGSRQTGDSFDLLVDETALLRELFGKWNTTRPDRSMGGGAVVAKWDHGTIGKLLLEHTAVWLAAREDVCRVFEELGRHEESVELCERHRTIRELLDQMYDNSHGIQPISVAITPGFVDGVTRLQETLRTDLNPSLKMSPLSDISNCLADERSRLRSAKFIRKHAPAHPGPVRRWYDQIPFLLRLHAAEDRLRGFPWGESSLGDRKLAERYDREI
jgi:hypothetical protein